MVRRAITSPATQMTMIAVNSIHMDAVCPGLSTRQRGAAFGAAARPEGLWIASFPAVRHRVGSPRTRMLFQPRGNHEKACSGRDPRGVGRRGERRGADLSVATDHHGGSILC